MYLLIYAVYFIIRLCLLLHIVEPGRYYFEQDGVFSSWRFSYSKLPSMQISYFLRKLSEKYSGRGCRSMDKKEEYEPYFKSTQDYFKFIDGLYSKKLFEPERMLEGCEKWSK
jgi:hypothetical protein